MNNRKAGRPVGTYKRAEPVRINGKLKPSYSRWLGMKGRCLNPNSHIWKYYGGRGITVCDRWLGPQGYDNFLADMGEPQPGMTLDRKRNSEGYSPDNCKWSTMQEQADNRRPPQHKINPNSLAQRAKAAGLSYSVVYQRCRLHGWSEEEALSTPHLGKGKPVGGWKRTLIEPEKAKGGEASLESQVVR